MARRERVVEILNIDSFFYIGGTTFVWGNMCPDIQKEGPWWSLVVTTSLVVISGHWWSLAVVGGRCLVVVVWLSVLFLSVLFLLLQKLCWLLLAVVAVVAVIAVVAVVDVVVVVVVAVAVVVVVAVVAGVVAVVAVVVVVVGVVVVVVVVVVCCCCCCCCSFRPLVRAHVFTRAPQWRSGVYVHFGHWARVFVHVEAGVVLMLRYILYTCPNLV